MLLLSQKNTSTNSNLEIWLKKLSLEDGKKYLEYYSYKLLRFQNWLLFQCDLQNNSYRKKI